MTQMTLTVAKLVKALFSRNKKGNPLKNWLKVWLQHVTIVRVMMILLLADTWWTYRKWKTSNAGQILSDSFDYSHEFQMIKTHDLREYDRSLTPRMGDINDHLEQVRHFILKNGFQELIIISCDLKTGNAYHLRQPLSLGGPQERYTIHTMLCNYSLVVPKWFLYKAWYWFFHFKAQGNNSSWKFRINCCKDWFQLNKTITIRIIINKLFVMIQG